MEWDWGVEEQDGGVWSGTGGLKSKMEVCGVGLGS